LDLVSSLYQEKITEKANTCLVLDKFLKRRRSIYVRTSMIAGGFGPFIGVELTGVLHEATANTNRRLTVATLHDVQFRGGHYYAIAEVTAHHHGGVGHFYYGLTTAPVPIEAPGRAISYGGHSMFVWEHPQDPLLPGLKLAATP